MVHETNRVVVSACEALFQVRRFPRFEVEEFREKIDYFITTIAEKHPDKWIFCIDIFLCRHDFLGNEKAEAFRAIVKEQVQKLAL